MHNLLKIMIFFMVCGSAVAAEVTRGQIKGLDEQVQDIKQDVLGLTTELSRLEEKLLFPSNTQASFFISLVQGSKFRLDSVQLKLDNEVVAHHLYTFRELEALQKGGVQRVFTGNVTTGGHDLAVSFIGKTASGGEVSKSVSYKLNKQASPKFVEIKITGSGSSEKSVSFRDW